MSKLSHLDDKGAARMVDVSAKPQTDREAVAESFISMTPEAFSAATSGGGPKGDVFAAARIAGIMAAKKTSELIPLCHPLALTNAGIAFEAIPAKSTIRIIATVKTSGQTGVEMEALTAASIAALTIYDMIKAVDKAAVIESVKLISKSGGKSGDYVATDAQASFKSLGRLSSTAPQTAPKRGLAKPTTLMGEVAAPRASSGPSEQRDAFRTFMTTNRLRATQWAKDADVPAAQILAYLTGRLARFAHRHCRASCQSRARPRGRHVPVSDAVGRTGQSPHPRRFQAGRCGVRFATGRRRTHTG